MNVEQARAQLAFRVAQQAVGARHAKNLLDYARPLPAMLQTNGLLASWAYLLIQRGKGEKKSELGPKLLLDALVERLKTRVEAGRAEALWPGGEPRGLLGIGERLNDAPNLSGSELRDLTAEAIESAVWLKRAAEALCAGANGTSPAGETSEGAS